MSGLKYWLWFAERERLGPQTVSALLERFGTPENIYFARSGEYAGIPGCTAGAAASLSDKSLEEAERTIAACAEADFGILTLADAAYPERLKNIFDPPAVLFIRGRLPDIDSEAAIAVVGTRSCTPYGIKTAERFGYEIARSGGLVVSGLAKGVDSAAAHGALRAGGRVVGVLGCGVDVVYPRWNRALFEDVAAGGAIISEYPPGTPPLSGHFPARNRIMSGISVGVVVVEAPEKSGALITAARALEQGRDVFAAPGNVDSESCAGSNALICEGAAAVTSGWDVTAGYACLFPEKLGRSASPGTPFLAPDAEERLVKSQLETPPKRRNPAKKVIDNEKNGDYIDIMIKPDELSPEEAAVLSAMTKDGMPADDIILGSGLSAQDALAALTSLEIKGAVTEMPGGRFSSHISVK